MTRSIVLGAVELPVQRFSGWNYPSFGTLVKVLSDGTSQGNEVLQTGGSPRRRAVLSGLMTDAGDVDTLHGYNLSKEILEVSETGGEELDACVLDFQAERTRPWLWSYTLTLVEADVGGS
jgi:hypothetical protein